MTTYLVATVATATSWFTPPTKHKPANSESGTPTNSTPTFASDWVATFRSPSTPCGRQPSGKSNPGIGITKWSRSTATNEHTRPK